MAKVIITAAITGGIHTPTMSPHLPITPQQIAEEAVRSYNAGAAIAHIHVRNSETGQPVSDVEMFREVATRVKSMCNMVLCFTTGGGLGMNTEERVRVVSALKPELASFNFGSVNFGLFHLAERTEKFKFDWERPYLEMTEDFIFPNTFKTLKEYVQIFVKNETKPELEIYDSGMINNIAFMLQRGHFTKPVYLQFVLGILGGISASTPTVVFLRNTAHEAFGDDFAWSVAAAGRHQLPMCAVALTMGGNARVGMEDSLYVGKGVPAKSNAEQVERIVTIAQQLSLEPAKPEEAREILRLKGLDKVNW
jgi:uncharacterized protein (DUF849 family)